MTTTFKKVFQAILAIVMVAALLLGCVACKPADHGGDVNSGNTGNGGNDGGYNYDQLSDEEYLQAMAQKELNAAAGLMASGFGAYADLAGMAMGNIGVTAEVDLMLGDLIIYLLETSLKQSTDMTMDFSFLSNIGLDMEIDSTDGMTQLSVALGLSDTEIAQLLLLVNDEAVWFGAPVLSDSFLTGDFASQGIVVSTAAPAWLEGMLGAIPSEEKLAEILERYIALALNEIDKVERSTETLTLDGLSQEATQLSAKIYEEDALDATKSILTAAKTDSDIKTIIESFNTYYNDMMAESYAQYEMEWTDEDLYASFTETIDSALAQLPAEAEDTENYISLTLYVDAAYNVIGSSIGAPISSQSVTNETNAQTADTGSADTAESGVVNPTVLYTHYTVTEGNSFKTLLEVETAGLKVTGSGTTNDGIITGTYAVAVQGVAFANVELKDFDMTDKDAISGTVTLKPTDEVIAAAFGDASALPVKDIALEVKLDTTKDQQDIEVKLVGDGAMIVGLALKAANRTPAAVQAPTNTVDMTDSDALMAWVSGLDFDSVLDNLTKAGVPEELVTALQSLIPAM